MPRRRPSRRLVGAAVTVLMLVALSVTGLVLHHHRGRPGPGQPQPTAAHRPNVIFFLADDLDKKLLPYMPHVRALIEDRGASFDRYYVEQSTCCTSRATMLSGQYVHNHGVAGNQYPRGGFFAWRGKDEDRALPVWLHAAGIRSALIGKYLNEYPYPFQVDATKPQKLAMRKYVPPGWDSWQVPVGGTPYQQFRYRFNTDGGLDPHLRTQYLDSELTDRIHALIGGADGMDFRAGGRLIWDASYSPHAPYAHPARLDSKFTRVRYPHTPSFNERDVSDKFGLARLRKPLTPKAIHTIDLAFRNRIRSVQVLDHEVATTVAQLRQQGTLKDTYLIFTSDNGYNMGEHRLPISKYNQFEETVDVPLFIAGPGIKAGQHLSTLAGNVDIAPTIADMLGATPSYATDGTSLLPLITGRTTTLGRSYLLLGRGVIPLNKAEPDPVQEFPESYVESPKHARVTDFIGVVSQGWKYVQYTHGHHEELYDLRHDPYEDDSLLPHGAASVRALSPATRRELAALRSALQRLRTCQGADCRFTGPG